MSWDITLTEEQQSVADIGNYTSNVASMYKKAMNKTLDDFHGRIANDILDSILIGYHYMDAYPEEYKKLNPENGWGNYFGAMKYLDKLIKACKTNPNAIINVN